jgi:hypothetical protein
MDRAPPGAHGVVIKSARQEPRGPGFRPLDIDSPMGYFM